MRVISGIYKHRRFQIPPNFKARPTTDFAKENLFNVLQNYIDFEEEDTVALDLFAGTGSISIELVSRGCRRVVSVEKDRQHCQFIRKVMDTVKTDRSQLFCTDVFTYIARSKETFDFVFADPPYALSKLAELPALVFRHSLLKPGGMLVLEHGKDISFQEDAHFFDHRNYGSVNFSFFKATD